MCGERLGRRGRPAHRLTTFSRRAAAAFLLALVALTGATAHAQTAPTVSSVAISSTPAEGQNQSYKIGDAVEAKVTFSGAVDVTGTPQLEIDVGGTPKTLSYSSGSNSDELVFTGYTVAEGDEDTDGISIGADKLTLNGGTIKKAGDTVNATLTHSATTAAAGQKVDGVRPRIISVNMFLDPFSFWSEALDNNSVPPASAFSLTVTSGETPPITAVRVDGHWVLMSSGRLPGPTAQLRLSYTPPTEMGTAPIRDLAGNSAEGFTGQIVGNRLLASFVAPHVSVTPGAGSLTVSWDRVSRVDSYRVQWKSGSEEFVFGGERHVLVSGDDTTSLTISNLAPGTYYTVNVTPLTAYGGDGVPGEATGTPLDAAVSTVAITSDPGSDDFYTVGDTIQAAVAFNGPVDVAGGNPELELDVGGTLKTAECGAGTAVTKIVCSYAVAANDADTDGVAIGANKLSRNGATIRLAGTEHDAVLTHAAVAADAGHKVDTTPPALSTVFVPTVRQTGNIVELTFDEALSKMMAPPGAFKVLVDSVARDVTSIALGSSTSLIQLTLASAVAHGETVTVVYTDTSADDDARALQDLAGNDVASFGPETVINIVPETAVFPAAPTDLRAVAKGPRTIELEWTAPADNGSAITGYLMEYMADGEAWSELWRTVNSLVTTYRHEGLHPGRNYAYRVSAISQLPDTDSGMKVGPASPSASAQTRGGAWISEAPASVAEGEEIVFEVTQTRGSRPVSAFRVFGAVRISDSGGVLGRVPLNYHGNGVYWMDLDEDHGTVRLPTRANGRIGEGGTVTLTLRSVEDDRLFGFWRAEPYTATVVVTDNESPGLRVEDAEANEADGTMDFRVHLTGAYSDPVTVDYATADRTATAGSDYTARSDTLTFAPGQTVKTVTVPILPDSVSDDGERFALTLSNPSGGVRIVDGEGLGTIRDMASTTAGPLTDFMLVDGASVHDLGAIVDGATLTLPDPYGVYRIRAVPSSAARIGSVRFVLTGAKSATRTEYEAPYDLFHAPGQTLPAGSYTLTATAYPPGEGEALDTLTVSFTVPESLVAAGDALSGLTLTNKTIGGVSAIGDGEDEDGTVFARAEGHLFEIAAAVADADVVGSVHLELFGGTTEQRTDSAAPYELFGGSGKALRAGNYTIRAIAYGNAGRGGSVLQVLSRSFTLGALTAAFEKAPAGHDGNAFTVRLRFSEAVQTSDEAVKAALSATGATVVSVRRVDGRAELREVRVEPSDSVTEVTVSLAATTDCAAAGAVCMADGLMLSGDASHTVPAVITVSVADAVGSEGATADFVVRLNKASASAVTVDYETVESTSFVHAATAGTDYTAQDSTLTFAAGQTKKTVSVALTSDTEADDGEFFWLVLSNATGARLREYEQAIFREDATGEDIPAVARGTIRDTADTPELTVLGMNGLESEDLPVRFPVVLAPASETEVTVDYATADGTAEAGADYRRRSGTLRFAPGQTLKVVWVPVIDDVVEDSGETLTLKLSNPSGATLATATVTATILNHDGPSLSVAPVQGLESGGALAFVVRLDRAAEETVTVRYATFDGTARAGEDYTEAQGTLEFLAGETEKTVTVAVAVDEVAEDDETLTLVLTDAVGAGIAGAVATGTIRETALVANADPTGVAVISGTAQVGAALTASVDGIADADGLDDATFAWQWVSNDGHADSDIADATEATYTPVLADAGKTLAVRVTFTDDGGTEEVLTSAVTGAVAPLEASFGAASYTAAEGGAGAEVAVTLSGDPGQDVTIALTATPGGGAEAADYTAPASVTFTLGGALTQTALVTAVSDEAAEDGESVALAFGELPEGVVAGATAQATVALADAGPVAAVLSVGGAPAQAGRFQVKAAFGEAVTGFAADDLAALRVGGDAASVSDVVEAETGRAWTAWVAAPEAGRYVVRLGPGAARSGDRESAAAVLAVDVDAEGNATAVAGPAVTAVSVAAPDGDALSWGPGDEIEVTLAFAEAVTVDTAGGTPTVGLTVGGTARTAPYASGTGTASLTFAYAVRAQDGTVSAVEVTASSLATAGATIRDGAGRAADLAHPGASRGLAGEPEAPAAPLTGFTLVDAATATDVGSIADGGAFTLDDPANGSYGIRVETAEGAQVGSVKLALVAGAKAVTRTDNLAPWSLYGDANGAVHGQGLPAGSYTLTATAHAQAGATGAVLQTLGVSFTVTAAETPGGDALTAAFQEVPVAHGGPGSEPFTFQVLFSEEIPVSYRVLRDQGAFAVTNGSVKKAKRVDGRDDLREVHIQPSGWDAVTVTLPATTSCAATGAICMGDERMLSNTETATVEGPVAIDVADAKVTEGPGATLDFVVSLSRASDATVTVDYATADGTATEGEDYTRTDGTLTFEAGQTEKTVAVPVLDDAHDDDGETLTFLLSNATGGARIRDGEAVGTIENSDAIPKAWLARFGRTVADHVVDAVGSRLAGPAQGGSHVTLGGQRIALDGGGAPTGADAAGERGLAGREAREGLAALADRMAGASHDGAPGAGGWTLRGEEEPGGDTRTMTGRELLLGSSFHLALGADGESAGVADTRWTAWGRAASSRFDGEADGLVLDGEVTTFTLGADAAWSRWLAGVAVSLSEGEGTYRDHETSDRASRGSGTLESSLTGVHPYARLTLSERLSAWGLLGFGAGELTLEVEGGERWTTDTSQEMAAAGARGVLVAAPEAGGLELALRADAVVQRMRSDAATSPAGGRLAASEARTSRVRLMLEGSHAIAVGDGGRLVPTLEVGLRQDGGDAETGMGIELGGGLAWTDPATGVAVEAKVRGLVAHEDADYGEWGASGSVRIAPGADGRGLTLTLSPAWGAAEGGAERLWSHRDARAFAPEGETEAGAGSRLEAELGYGFSVLGGRAVATPWAGMTRSEADETLRLGQRLTMGASQWSLESAFGAAGRSYSAGYGYRVRPSLDLTLEASRREAANDNAPEHEIMLRAGMRW